MAEKRTISLEVELENGDKVIKQFEQLDNGVKKLADSAENLDAKFEDVYKGVEPLTTRLGEAEDRLYELALAGDTTSKEYQELLEKVGQYRKVQIQTDQVVDGAAQTLNQKLGSALNGVTSAFAATQGAMALFGSENEALEKTLLKVQAALAIQQGVKGLSDAYKELGGITGIVTGLQKAFNAVLKANPIVLIASGIAAAVAALATFTDVLDPVIDKLKQFSDFIGLTNFAEQEQENERQKRYEQEKKRIEELQLRQQAAFDQRQKQFDVEIRALRLSGKETIELEKQKIQASIEYQKQKVKELQLILKTSEGIQDIQLKGTGKLSNIARAYQRGRQKQVEQLEQLNIDIANSELDLKELIINYNKDKADSYKEVQDAQQEALDAEIDAEIQLIAELDKIRQENEARFRTDEENELNAVAEKYDVLESMAYGNAEALNEIEIARLNEENEIKAKYATEAYNAQKALDDKADAEEKERRDKQLENIKAYQEAEQAIRMANLDNAAAGVALLKDLAGENRKLQALGIAAENAVGIAKIIISTQAANAAAKLKYAAIPGGVALAAAEITANKISAGIGIAASIAAAAKGISALKESASLDSGGDLGGDSGAGGGEVVPQFNVVGDSGINQLAQLQQQPTQAFVVSGEVTSAQALDRNRVTNATL